MLNMNYEIEFVIVGEGLEVNVCRWILLIVVNFNCC